MENVAAPVCHRARKQRIVRQGAKLCKGKANALRLQIEIPLLFPLFQRGEK